MDIIHGHDKHNNKIVTFIVMLKRNTCKKSKKRESMLTIEYNWPNQAVPLCALDPMGKGGWQRRQRVHHIAGKAPRGGRMGGLFGALPSRPARRVDQLPDFSNFIPDRAQHVPERSERLPSSAAIQRRQEDSLQLHLPAANALGCFENIQQHLKSISLAKGPLIPSSHFLEQPRSQKNMPTFLWSLSSSSKPQRDPSKPALERNSLEDETFDTFDEPPVQPDRLPTKKDLGLALELAPDCSWMRPGEIFGKPASANNRFEDLPAPKGLFYGGSKDSKGLDSFAKDVELQLAVPRHDVLRQMSRSSIFFWSSWRPNHPAAEGPSWFRLKWSEQCLAKSWFREDGQKPFCELPWTKPLYTCRKLMMCRFVLIWLCRSYDWVVTVSGQETHPLHEGDV